MTESSRPTLDLDGAWTLTLESAQVAATVVVPGPWTTQLVGHGASHETVEYTRSFEVPDGWATGRTAHLLFGGVNHSASVTLNGHRIGEHVGGWTPFEFELGDTLRAGTNQISVIVSYPPRIATPGQPGFTEVPHGKQSWYGPSAGIWQSVSIETRSIQHLTATTVRADAATGVVQARVGLARPAQAGDILSLRVVQLDSAEVSDGNSHDAASINAASISTASISLEPGAETAVLTVQVAAPLRWSPDSPQLYAATVELASITDNSDTADGLDSVTRAIGFRTIETRDGAIILNGEPLEIRAVLDQDYHLGSSTIPESDEALETLFAETKRLGFNMLRCHIKRPDQRYYDLADRMGLLVWTELPSWLTMTRRGAEDGVQLLADLIALDGHHPSIVIWTIINESWGIDLRDADQRAWLRRTFDVVKALVPDSLVVDNSACEPNFHLKSDLDDFHIYRGIPESRVAWDEKIAEFARRPDWTYSPYGDAERSNDEPLLLSEYGNWALPNAFDQFGPDGSEPWWFANGAHWAFGAAEGTGLAARFVELGLEEAFGSWEALVSALHHSQMVANRYQTGSIRAQASISGYVLTQLSDVQWEANGLFDMMRSPKQFNEDFRLINSETAVVLRPDVYSTGVGGQVAVTLAMVPARPLRAVHGAGAELRVLVNGALVQSSQVAIDERSHRGVELTMPGQTGEVELAAELWAEGELIARDAATIVVLADSVPALARSVHAADAEVGVWLSQLGFTVAAGPAGPAGRDDLVVTRAFDADAQAHARRGGRVLVLAEEQGALCDAFDYLPIAKLGPRDGDGDWVPRQEWLRRDGAFAALPGAPLLGIAYEDLLGALVINGIPAAMRPAQVHSAIFSGWLRHAATTTATVAWSDGEVTLTTFRVRKQVGQTPLAVALGRALVAHGARA